MTRRAAGLAGLLTLLVGASGASGGAAARPTDGTVDVTIHHSTFDPGSIAVRPGERVRFVIRNTDPIDHEFIVGDAYVQQIHEDGTEPSHAPRPGEMSVPAGTTQVTTYTFPNGDGHLIFACHLPGHYAYGMRGLITIQG